jgi:hypothetical protein
MSVSPYESGGDRERGDAPAYGAGDANTGVRRGACTWLAAVRRPLSDVPQLGGFTAPTHHAALPNACVRNSFPGVGAALLPGILGGQPRR